MTNGLSSPGARRTRLQRVGHLNRRSILVLCLSGLLCNALSRASAPKQKKDEGEFSRYAGDSPSKALPYATDLSPALRKKDVALALQKVADWQLNKSQRHFDRDWTFAVLYTGFMAVPNEAGGERYRAAMKSMGESFHWSMGPNELDANDQAIAQTYLALYELDQNPDALRPIKERMDRMMLEPEVPGRNLWWWCDALFMSPPVLAELTRITHQQSYLDFMDRQWWKTSAELYDQKQLLFFRDARFLTRHELNGQSIFWSRGNGWVIGGLVKVLQAMPKDYPSRSAYVTQFQQMATALITAQRADGLWSAGLLDPVNHPMAETSGTALITYGLAYGINEGMLDRNVYEPHVEKAWQGLVAHIYADGRLGAIQPVGDSPGKFKPTSSYVYGMGGFLLAGSEIYRMAGDQDK